MNKKVDIFGGSCIVEIGCCLKSETRVLAQFASWRVADRTRKVSKMKPVIFVLIALGLYSLQNVVFEQKLTRLNTFSVLVYSYLVMLPFALVGLFLVKPVAGADVMPTGQTLATIAFVGTCWFLADALYIGAYAAGGDMFTITSIMIMLPVGGTIIRYFWVGGLPNRYQMVGYLCAAAAVLLIAKGKTTEASVLSP